MCDLFVTFKSDVENLFSIIKIDNASPKIERLSIFNIPQEVRQIDIVINNNKKTSGYMVDVIVFYEKLENFNYNETIEKISQLYSLQEEKYKKITK